MLLSHPLLKFSPCDEQESLVAGEGSNKKRGLTWSHCGRICLKVHRFRCQIFGGCLEDHPRTDVSSLQRMVIVSPLARVIPVPNGPNGLSMGLTK